MPEVVNAYVTNPDFSEVRRIQMDIFAYIHVGFSGRTYPGQCALICHGSVD